MQIQVTAEEHYSNNTVYTTGPGQDTLTAYGDAKFERWAAGWPLYGSSSGFLGYIKSVVSNSQIKMDRELPNIASPGEHLYIDVTRECNDVGEIAKRLESDNFLEAGLIVYDDVSIGAIGFDMIKPHGANVAISTVSNPIRTLLCDGDFDAKRRMIIRINVVENRFGETDAAISTDDGDVLSAGASSVLAAHYKAQRSVQVFEGIVDYLSIEIEEKQLEEEDVVTRISFTVKDKLSALQTIAHGDGREIKHLYPDVLSTNYHVRHIKMIGANITFLLWYESGGVKHPVNNPLAFIPVPGSIIRSLKTHAADAGLYLITGVSQIPASNNQSAWRVFATGISSMQGTFYNAGTQDDTYVNDSGIFDWTTNAVLASDYEYYDYLFAGKYIYIDGNEEFSPYYSEFTEGVGIHPVTHTITMDQIQAIDGIKLLEAMICRSWPGITLANCMSNEAGDVITSFPINLQYGLSLIDDAVFGDAPYDAVKRLVKTMGAYLFVDKDGKFTLVNRAAITLGKMPSVTYGGWVMNVKRKPFYDKVADEVTVTVRGFTKDESNAFYEGSGSAYKIVGIKARNSVDVSVALDNAMMHELGITTAANGSLEMGGETDQNVILNAYADAAAEKEFQWYGLRRESKEIEMAALQWHMLFWGLAMSVSIRSVAYYITRITMNVMNEQCAITVVEKAGHEYNAETVVIGKKRDEYFTGG